MIDELVETRREIIRSVTFSFTPSVELNTHATIGFIEERYRGNNFLGSSWETKQIPASEAKKLIASTPIQEE